jgi:hypothetical protein
LFILLLKVKEWGRIQSEDRRKEKAIGTGEKQRKKKQDDKKKRKKQ